MQNVYDIAHELSRSLKETDQYKDYKKYKEQIDANEGLKKMVDDFTAQNLKVQSILMTGETPDQELIEKSQQIYALVMQDPTCAAYLNAQISLSSIVSDLYKILGEALE